MQYLLIILINIFMWAIFYLVITLKLEKSASHFRERKFREEMDRLMTEFNSAADRNITLLENRISTLKKLLERTGNLDSVDLILGSEKENTEEINDLITQKEKSHERINIEMTEHASHSKPAFLKKSGESFKLLTRKFNHLVERLRNFTPEKRIEEEKNYSKFGKTHEEQGPDSGRGSMLDMVLEKGTFSQFIKEEEIVKKEISRQEEKDLELPGDDEISYMFLNTDDKFSVISQLYGMGYSVEKISECSGMPAGEVKLILNLRKPAG